MAKYVLGKNYNVQEQTENNNAATWRKYLEVIEAKGYITDFEAEAICLRDKNRRYFSYVSGRGWLVRKNEE